MTLDQQLTEIRKALAVDERLASMLLQVAKGMADKELRHLYSTNEAAAMIRGTGIAEGIEKFVATITKAP